MPADVRVLDSADRTAGGSFMAFGMSSARALPLWSPSWRRTDAMSSGTAGRTSIGDRIGDHVMTGAGPSPLVAAGSTEEVAGLPQVLGLDGRSLPLRGPWHQAPAV